MNTSDSTRAPVSPPTLSASAPKRRVDDRRPGKVGRERRDRRAVQPVRPLQVPRPQVGGLVLERGVSPTSRSDSAACTASTISNGHMLPAACQPRSARRVPPRRDPRGRAATTSSATASGAAGAGGVPAPLMSDRSCPEGIIGCGIRRPPKSFAHAVVGWCLSHRAGQTGNSQANPRNPHARLDHAPPAVTPHRGTPHLSYSSPLPQEGVLPDPSGHQPPHHNNVPRAPITQPASACGPRGTRWRPACMGPIYIIVTADTLRCRCREGEGAVNCNNQDNLDAAACSE